MMDDERVLNGSKALAERDRRVRRRYVREALEQAVKVDRMAKRALVYDTENRRKSVRNALARDLSALYEAVRHPDHRKMNVSRGMVRTEINNVMQQAIGSYVRQRDQQKNRRGWARWNINLILKKEDARRPEVQQRPDPTNDGTTSHHSTRGSTPHTGEES